MTTLDIPTTGNMPNPIVEKRREKEWEKVYKSPMPVSLEDFRNRDVPPVVQRFQEPQIEPCYTVKPYAED